MSYYRIFKPTKDQMEHYNYSFGSAQFVKGQMKMKKAELRTKVMYPGNIASDGFSSIYYDVMKILQSLQNYAQDYAKKNIYNSFVTDENQEVVFQGRQYSYKDVEDPQELLENTCEKLVLLLHAPSGSMIDRDNEDFYAKLEMVDTEIDYFIEEMQEIAIWEVIEDIEGTEQPDDFNDYTVDTNKEQNVKVDIINNDVNTEM